MFVCCIALLVAAQCSPADSVWSEEGEGYYIELHYPEVALENETMGARLEEYAMEQVSIFKKNVEETFNPDFDTIDWSLEINFVNEPSPEGLICSRCARRLAFQPT